LIKKYTCKNGVRIILEEMPILRSVAIGIWVKTGSRNESPEINGISHFIEHMFFKGTKSRSAKEIAESFDRIGGQVNAFTSKEYTCFYAKVLDTHASYALEVLSDMFFNSVFDEKELEKERKVVLEEIKMYEDTPDDIVHDLLSKAIYENHPLGYPILGTEETLQSFTNDMLKQYIHSTYTPENVVISVAGNITDSFIQEIEEIFGSYEAGTSEDKKMKPVFNKNCLTRKKDTEQVHLCLGFEGLPIGSDDIYHLIIANNILGGSMSSRLFQEVREQKGLAYSIFSYHTSFEDSGIVAIYGGTGADQLDLLFDTIQYTLDTFVHDGITEKELINTKEQLKGNLMLGLEGTNSRMSRNGKNELLLGEHRTPDQMIELIDSITKEDVNRMAKRIFTKEFSVALISPDGKLPKALQ
jgi:predicted Zn-dependent peptidase